jgi:hypothetical protein
MRERDRVRLQGLVTRAVQCDPSVSHAAVQTEFLTPEVGVRIDQRENQ